MQFYYYYHYDYLFCMQNITYYLFSHFSILSNYKIYIFKGDCFMFIYIYNNNTRYNKNIESLNIQFIIVE